MPSLKGFCHPAESLTQFQHSPHSVKLDMMMMIKICIVYHTGTFSWGCSCRGGPLILLNGPSLLKMQIAKYFANGVEVQASMQARTQASTWESKQAKYRGYRIALTLFAQGGHSYLIFVIFLHAHILSHENFTPGKSVNLRQNCLATKQRKSLSVKVHTECKITHQV